jgi:hypothetical protein
MGLKLVTPFSLPAVIYGDFNSKAVTGVAKAAPA